MGDKRDAVKEDQKVERAAESGIRLISRPLPAADTSTAFVFSGGARGALHVSAVRVLLEAGMRLGELLALRWRDVDLDTATLHVLSRACATIRRCSPQLASQLSSIGITAETLF